MRKITEEELKKIIENHKHWLEEDCEDWRDMRADLSGANLSGADLSGAGLRMANLNGADLRGADLRGAELTAADLIEADLSGAKLCVAGFRRANLRRANFSGANLRGADLRGADLSGADLSGADFSWADLRWADLRWAINIPFIPMACPETGSFTAYKKASGKIVKLLIPVYARRSSATGRKCRCDKALVVEIQNMDGTKADVDHVSSDYDDGFVYTVGETVCVTDFCEDRFEECAEGIHFFINRQEAVEYGD